MSMCGQFGEPDIDALVRAHLLHRGQTVDAARILAEVQARMEMPESATEPDLLPFDRRSPAPRWHRLGWRLAVAMGVLLAVCLSLQVEPGQASATTLVQEARMVHGQPVDRCYQIETQLEPDMMEPYGVLPLQRKARLWTRGDRFWMEASKGTWQWSMGLEEGGRVWFSPSRKTGFRFEAAEVPENLRIACDLRSMRVESLLRQVLADYDLREETPAPGRRGTTRLIRATLKPDFAHNLKAATMEMDGDSKVLQRVVLSRRYRRGAATVTFTLVGTGVQDDRVYHLQSHLDPDARIFSGGELPKRLQLMKRQFDSPRP
jgi:hypothetical protein